MRGLEPLSKAIMIAIIFEVRPAAGRKDDYLAHAKRLLADVEQIDGFISVERFQSLTDPDKMLSLSFFRDEEAVARWRNHARHRATQTAGRDASSTIIGCAWPRCCATTA